MRRLVVMVALVVGCGGEAMESSVPKDASGLYAISADGSTVTVPGGSLWYSEPATDPHLLESYALTCFVHEGKSLERAELSFRRADAASPWRFERVNWYLGACR